MGYSARRGFSSGNLKSTGAQRQAEVQQKIAQMQEAMNNAQEEVEARSFTASVGGGAVEAVANGKKEPWLRLQEIGRPSAGTHRR